MVLLHKVMWKGMGLHFFIGKELFKNWILLKKAFWKSKTILLQEKPIFLSLAVKIIFSNFSAVQTKHGSNKLMGKKVQKIWATGRTIQKLKKGMVLYSRFKKSSCVNNNNIVCPFQGWPPDCCALSSDL